MTGFTDTDIVRRVPDTHGSHIEPELDPTWPDLDKLRWHAAVATHDTGLHVRVTEGRYRIGGVAQPGYYCVQLPGTGSGPYRFQEAWTLIHGISLGITAAARGQA